MPLPRHLTASLRTRAVLLAGLGLTVLLFIRLGPAQIAGMFQAIGWNIFVIVGIFGVHECVRALAVRRCLLDEAPPFPRLLEVRFIGEGLRTLTSTGPFLSEPARAWMLARDGVPGARASAAAISEFVVNGCVSGLVGAAALMYVRLTFGLHGPIIALIHVVVWSSLVYVAGAVLAIGRRQPVLGVIVTALQRLPVVGRRLQMDPVQVRRAEEGVFQVLRDNPTALRDVILLEVIAQGLLVLDVYWTLHAMNMSSSALMALAIEVLTKLANLIQMGGATEGGYAMVFDWLGMAATAGFTLSIVKRVRSLAVAAVGVVLIAPISRGAMAVAMRPYPEAGIR